MAINDFSNQNIQDTYQRVVQTDGTNRLADGTGSVFIPVSSSHAITASHALFAVSASHEITFELSSSHAQTASFISNGIHELTSAEVNQLKNINTNTISDAQFGFVGSMNQSLATTNEATFTSIILSGVTGADVKLPTGATVENPHIKVRSADPTPSIFLGDNSGDIITFVSQEGTAVARISQEGTYIGTVANGLTTNTAQSITGVKTLGTSTKLQFRDSGIYLNSNTDGTLQIVSDDKVNIYGNNVKIFAPITASGVSSSESVVSNKYEFGYGGSSAYLQATDAGSLLFKFVHSKFEGNITASGNISASAHINAGQYLIKGNKFGGLKGGTTDIFNIGNSGSGSLNLTNVTASGNISASGHITASDMFLSGDLTLGKTDDSVLTIVSDGSNISHEIHGRENQHSFLSTRTTQNLGIGLNTDEIPQAKLHVSGNISASGDLNITNITSSGNISASGTSHTFGGNIAIDTELQHIGDADTKIGFSDDVISIKAGNNESNFRSTGLQQEGHITASGNISASGTVFASALDLEGANLTYNATHDILKFGDNVKLGIGAGPVAQTGDLTISSDGTDSSISATIGNVTLTNTSGNTIIRNQGISKDIILQTDKNPGGQQGGQVLISGSNADVRLQVLGNITASGNISASGDLIASSSLTLGAPLSKIIGPGGNDFMALGVDNIDIFINNSEVINVDNDSINLNSSAQAINTIIASDDGTNLVMADATNNAVRLNNHIIMSPGAPTDYTNRLLVSGSSKFIGNITASGNISASGDIITKKLRDGGGNNHIVFGDQSNTIAISSDDTEIIRVDGDSQRVGINKTAPGEALEVVGNISASGNLNASHITASGNVQANHYYGYQLSVHPSNFTVALNGDYYYVPLTGQSTAEHATSNTNERIPLTNNFNGHAIKTTIRSTNNNALKNAKITCSIYYSPPNTAPGSVTPGNTSNGHILWGEAHKTGENSTHNAIHIDWRSGIFSGSFLANGNDIPSGSRVYLAMKSDHASSVAYVVSTTFAWDYSSL